MLQLAIGGIALAVALAATGPVVDPGDGGNYAPALDPADFVETIDNPLLPYLAGARWVYEGESGGEPERTEVTVTDQRRDIQGISATVVRDTVYAGDQLIEDTYDWFAQDREGNVWYLGEDTSEYENGEVVSKAGSWEHGVDGAYAGIVMPAQPAVGQAFRQEYYPGEAEDMAEVLRTGETLPGRYGPYQDVVVTEDWTPLEPETIENKAYAPGIGMVYSTHVAGGLETIELVAYTPGG
jgi:hypothetical protein